LVPDWLAEVVRPQPAPPPWSDTPGALVPFGVLAAVRALLGVLGSGKRL
jgi:hypothetical protein